MILPMQPVIHIDTIDETIDVITDTAYSSRQAVQLIMSRFIDAKDTTVDSYRNHRQQH